MTVCAITSSGRASRSRSTASQYELRYHAYAFIQYADAVGGDLLHDLRTLGESLRGFEAAQHDADAPPVALAPLLLKIRDALWAGLIEAHPDVTRDDVARMFGFSDLNAIAPVMMQAITRTLPDAPKAPRRALRGRRRAAAIYGRTVGSTLGRPP